MAAPAPSELTRASTPLSPIFDWFISDALRKDPESLRQARMIVVVVGLLLGIDMVALFSIRWGPSAVPNLPMLPNPIALGLLGLLPLLFSVAFIVRRTDSTRRARHLLPLSVLVMVSYLAYFDGGMQSVMLQWLVLVPLLAALLSGPRVTLQIATATLAVVMAYYGMDLYDVPLPQTMDTLEGPAMRVRVGIVVLGVSTFVAWSFERSRARYTEALKISNLALRSSEQNLRQIAQSIGQALWMYDTSEDRVLFVNDMYERLFGSAQGNLLSDPNAWREAVFAADRDQLPDSADAVDHIYRVRHADGFRWIRHTVYGFRDETLGTTRQIHIAADVTRQVEAEEVREQVFEAMIAAAERERRHLSRELHDETSQSLAALLVGLKALESRTQEPKVADMLGKLRQQTRQIVEELGRLARGLHPAVLDEIGLEAAVRTVASDASGTAALETTVRCEPLPPLPSAVQLAAYRIIQEGVGNIVKHANATVLDVSLFIETSQLIIRIEDDGTGFDAKKPRQLDTLGGLGLLSMRERATQCGGEIAIESSAGMGTTVVARLPLQPETGGAMRRRRADTHEAR